MKSNLLLLSLLLWVNYGLAQQVSGETVYLGTSEKGTILLSCQGYGNNKKTAKIHAEKAAFQNLLFKGIPGSTQYVPLVGKNPASVQTAHADFFQSFFDQQQYERFILSRSWKKNRPKKQGSKLSVQLKIDVAALRSYLEEHQVIRKFGL